MLLASTFLLVGCGSDGADSVAEDSGNVCGDEDWCWGSYTEGAYHPTHGSFFCYVEQARNSLLEDQDADPEDFVELMPDWGVDEERAGEPILLDVSELHPWDLDHALQELDDPMQEFGCSYDRTQYRSGADAGIGDI